jgi:hypothetical protein
MWKKRKNTEEPAEAEQAAQQMPIVKPDKAAAFGTGRNTLEDRVGIAVRPARATSTTTSTTTRSTFRDLRPV